MGRIPLKEPSDAWDKVQVVELEVVPNPPGDIVIRARRITADANASNNPRRAVLNWRVEGQPSSEYIHSAHFLTNQRIGAG